MNRKSSVFIAALALTASVGSAAEEVWPKNSAGDVSVMATLMRFRIYADHCAVEVPQLKPKFESLMKDLDTRIQGISKGVLATDEFRGMKDKAVPAEIVDALDDSFHDGKESLERRDAASACPMALGNFGVVDDESLKSSLTANLKAVQNMIEKLAQK
jgi:hypothetical protein